MPWTDVHRRMVAAVMPYLGISRPTLIKLIGEGKIPCETIDGSRHRRLVLGDLIDYQTRRSTERRAALQTMAGEAEDMGLYDIPVDDYQNAIRAARKAIAEDRNPR